MRSSCTLCVCAVLAIIVCLTDTVVSYFSKALVTIVIDTAIKACMIAL